ncbi:MAG: SGNH/GDSL hydrolase family protein [Clostridiales bacterium]|nr:SGNH/GDSL hydrolase family protein [Clostridiales bacterium]
MKKILLIGDSIRLSYQESVKKKLEGKAEVFGPEENCRFAKYTLWNVKPYLEGKPDIVHWNNGIWDAYHEDSFGGIFTPQDEYLHDITRVLMYLKTTGATIIWASTTAVTEECSLLYNNEIDVRNQAVAQMMKSHGVRVNDLNAVVKKDIDNFTAPDGFHLSEAGIRACAQQVSDVLMEYLD